jgi:tRNA pseudouridine55 synthase
VIILNGIIVINKEKGYTSNDVVQIVKKIFKEKVGHTGTLDPMATGVLPLLVGKGTQCSKYLINHDKIYTATLKLGIKTDTGDITGNVVEEKNVNKDILNFDYVTEVLKKFVGNIEQMPPMYSAIKINGKKLYEYARKGQAVDIKPRNITIYNIELISIEAEDIKFKVSCSKGTYIRTLCEDIAKALGTVGTMSELNREKVGDFDIQNSVTLNELKEKFESEDFLKTHFFDIERIFESKGKIVLTPRSLISFINGAKLFTDDVDEIYRVYDIKNNFLGTGVVKSGILKRDIIL